AFRARGRGWGAGPLRRLPEWERGGIHRLPYESCASACAAHRVVHLIDPIVQNRKREVRFFRRRSKAKAEPAGKPQAGQPEAAPGAEAAVVESDAGSQSATATAGQAPQAPVEAAEAPVTPEAPAAQVRAVPAVQSSPVPAGEAAPA